MSGVVASSTRVTDIAVNLADCVFRGFDWKNKKIHADDFTSMMARADAAGVHRSIISGTSLEQCVRALYLCRQFPGKLYCTIGVHPANSSEFLAPVNPKLAKFIRDGGCGGDAMGRGRNGDGVPRMEPFSSLCPLLMVDPTASAHTYGSPMTFESLSEEVKEAWKVSGQEGMQRTMIEAGEQRLELLKELILQNRDVVVAVGECGLDGTETTYCPLHVQEYFFRRQIHLAQKVDLPLFLHSRECGMQFADVICGGNSTSPTISNDNDDGNLHNIVKKVGGVVHSFCGGVDELQCLLTKTPLYLGLNGTAFRSEETAMMCCNNIPLNRLMLETDSPWCDIRKDNFGFKFIKTVFPTKKKDKFVEGCCVERRNEPCHMRQVLEVYEGCLKIAKPDDMDIDEVSILNIGNMTEANVNNLFFPKRGSPT